MPEAPLAGVTDCSLTPGQSARLAGESAGLPDGVALFDADWRFVWLDDAGAALLQRPPAELLGRVI